MHRPCAQANMGMPRLAELFQRSFPDTFTTLLDTPTQRPSSGVCFVLPCNFLHVERMVCLSTRSQYTNALFKPAAVKLIFCCTNLHQAHGKAKITIKSEVKRRICNYPFWTVDTKRSKNTKLSLKKKKKKNSVLSSF